MNNQTTTQVIRQPGIAAKIAMVFAVGTMAGGGIMYSIAQRPREAQATTALPAEPPPTAPLPAPPQPVIVQIITPPLPEGTRIEVRNAGADSQPVATVTTRSAQDATDAESALIYGPPPPPQTQDSSSKPPSSQPGTVVSIPVSTAPIPASPTPQQALAPVKQPAPSQRSEPMAFSGTPSVENKVNINTASQAVLELLPQVGPAMAKKIIDYREKNGAFKDPKELDRIKGIGPKTLEKLLPLVTTKEEKPAR